MTTATRKKVILVDTHSDNNDQLQVWFSSNPGYQLLGVFNSPVVALQSLSILPELAIIGMDIPNGIKFCQILRNKNPAVAIVLLTNQPRAKVEDQMRQAGALDVLARGASSQEISKAVRSATSLSKPVLCSFMGIGGIKEGVGTTIFSCILADFMGKILPDKVLLIDLVPLRGDLAFNFGMSSKINLRNLLRQNDFLHPGVFQKYLQRTSRGFYLLASSQEPESTTLDTTLLIALLTVLGNFFELIILDLPPYPFHGQEEIIDICDNIVINIGETPNQLKLVFQMANSDFQSLPETFTNRFSFVSWTQHKGVQSGITGALPKTVFLPKPSEAMFSNPNFSVTEGGQFEPLRKNIRKFLAQIPVLSLYSVDGPEKGEEQSLWSYLGSWLQS